MLVTVAICTWNRAALLDKTLTEMRRLHIPAGVGWELMVVNNRCTDDTDEIIARHASQLPLRRLYEPMPGKSNALNTAVAAIRSDLILWTDDDVLVDRDWLAEHVAAANALPQASFFGGPIEPWFEVSPPHWLTSAWSRISEIYATRDVGGTPSPIDAQFHPYGANFAIRTEVQRRFLYDPRLGRVGPSVPTLVLPRQVFRPCWGDHVRDQLLSVLAGAVRWGRICGDCDWRNGGDAATFLVFMALTSG